jgi:hypothetical protein
MCDVCGGRKIGPAILMRKETRERPSQIGKKSKTNNEIINKPIQLKTNWKKDLLDRNGIETPNDQANPEVHRRRNPP